MRKVKLFMGGAISLILSILLHSSTFALPSNPAVEDNKLEAGHAGLTKLSAEIKRKLSESDPNGLKAVLGGDDAEEIRAFKKFLSAANVAEDFISSTRWHFYDPDTKQGFLGVFQNAKDRAKDWYSGAVESYCNNKNFFADDAKKRAWESFGHTLHLMQDMTTPSHTNNNSHISPTDSYEQYVADNWDSWHPSTPNEAKIQMTDVNGDPMFDTDNNPLYYSGLKAYLEDYVTKPFNQYEKSIYMYPGAQSYFDYLAKDSKLYPHDRRDIDILDNRIEEISWPDKKRNAMELLPRGMMYGAGLINTFWKDINTPDICKKPPALVWPGGDHPDDRFDVSDAFYLEENFNLSFDELTDLNFRTGIKKGKTGLIYFKQALDAYTQAVTASTDADKRTAQKKLNELSKITLPNSGKFQEDFKTAPDIALFSYGFNDAMTSLLLKYKEPVAFKGLDFDPSMVKDHPVMVIPSGGLYGQENSTFFKAQLDEYVKQGGTLIVFAQQHGCEFNALPVPQDADGTFRNITGYGWTEDQSCFTNAVYIDTQHQMMSSISKSTPTLSVDGYFTNYPSNTTVLLRRTANGQPSMIMYEHGLGKVIVTSMYSDFAYSHSQASPEEIALVRDMISWAKKPAQLPEIKPGETVSVNMEIKNLTTIDAVSVKLLIYNPDRITLLSEQIISVSIPAGSTFQLITHYALAITATLGIYHIDYELYDSTGIIIQPQAENESGRFIVSNPPSNPYQSPDISFAVNSDSEHYIYGSNATFTVTIWNNGNTDRTITASYKTYHLNVSPSSKAVMIPAHSSASFQVTVSHVYHEGWLVVKFYDGNAKNMGERWKGIWMLPHPSINVAVQTDKTDYPKGDTVILNTLLRNDMAGSYDISEKTTVTDPSGVKVFEDTRPDSLTPYGTSNISNNFTLPQTAATGTYTVRTEAWYGSRLASTGSTTFELPQSQISVTPNLTAAFSTGVNAIPFTLNNTGRIGVNSGILDVSLKYPDGIVVYSGSQPFSLGVGQNITLNLPGSIPSLKLGNYALSYTQADETRSGKPVSVAIFNKSTLAILPDKATYKIGETSNIIISLNNAGDFVQNGILTVDAPFLGFSDTKTITVHPSNTVTMPYSLLLPISLNSGGIINAVFATPSGEQIANSFLLSIAPIKIDQNLVFDKPSYRIREALGMNCKITNNGSFSSPLNASLNLSIPDLNYTYDVSLVIEPDKTIEFPLSVEIPETVSSGQHQVLTSIALPSGLVYEGTFSFTIPKSNLVVTGPAASSFAAGDMFDLMVENIGGVDTTYTTEKVTAIDNNSVMIFQNNITDAINAGEKKLLTSVQIPQQTLTGPLYLQAVLNNADTGLKVSYYRNIYIDGIEANLSAITDKDHYFKTESVAAISALTNTNLNIEEGLLDIKVKKPVKDATVQFKQFLPKPGEWLFDYVSGVAVSRDNYLYAVDNRNYNIWKFNSSGELITKWGGYGSANGKFYSPWAIAVAGDGSVLVLDRDSYTIQKFDSNGIFISKWGASGNGDGQFDAPNDIAIANDNTIYVADGYNYRIQKFDGNGNFIAKFGSYGNGDGQFWNPYSLAVDSDGFVYVTDYSQNRIQKFDSNGNFITKWGSQGSGDGQFETPRGIAVGPDSSVYVVDTWNSRIQKFDGNGNFIDKWGSYGSGDGQFYTPQHGIAVGPDSSVYVADTFNDRIQKHISQSDVLFETTIPITQSANTTQDYTNNIGTLNTTGKLYLQAELKNSLGQTIAMSEYPFYIIDGSTLLLFSTDKKYYKPNETVTISGEVRNLTSINVSMLGLQLSTNSQNIYNATFDVPANGSYPFTATTTSGTEGLYTLSGKVTQNSSTLIEISDQYEVSNAKVTATVTTPDIVGNEPFDMRIEIKNDGKVNASIQLSAVNSQGDTIDGQQITIPAGETKQVQYRRQMTSETTYTFIFTGDLNQTITKNVEYGLNASVSVDVSGIYAEGQIIIPYYISNAGVLEAAYPVIFTLMKDGQEISKDNTTVTLPVSGSSLGSLSYNLSEGLYTLKYETTGFNAEAQINVVKPGQGEIALSMSDVYPEETISIPYIITNTGQFDSEFTVEFMLGTNVTPTTVFIPAGVSYPDMLQYSLSAGSYTITARTTSYPSTPVSKSFIVLREISADMVVSIGAQTDSLIPVTVNLTNTGYNEINGSVQLSVISSQGATVWNSVQAVSQLATGSAQLSTFNITTSGLALGDYTIKVELLNNSSQQLVLSSQSLTINGPLFQITQLPAYQTFNVGQEGSFTFKIKNTGNQEGSTELNLKAYDLIDSTQGEWLKPGEEKTISFSFLLPDDLEEKDYQADYELKTTSDQPSTTRGQINYHLSGINLNVSASLDKQYYTEGETAHLIINIQTPTPNPQSLFARVNYKGYENQQTFTLNGSQTLAFDIPLTQITGEKLFYGIYHESGRSIHLNSLYIYKSGDTITLTTDKQVYNPGETVMAAISSQQSAVSGTMTVTAPDYAETIDFNGSASRSFTLPSIMTAGTYNISAQLSTVSGETYTASHPFDVSGIQVKVLECKNNKGKYASSDTITTNLTISSNTTMPATLKAWIVDPEGKYTSAGEQSINLTSAENLLLTSDFSLTTAVSGIHRLVYGIYAGEMLLVSGSEAFDVGDAVLLGLSTDKADYPINTELVNIAVSMFGTVDVNLELQVDGTTVKTKTVSLNGFSKFNSEIGNALPGTHILKAILTAGGLKSTKETSFVYGSNLPDLTTAISYQQLSISNDNTVEMTSTVINQGRTASAATTITLYDGDTLIETQQVNALNSGETQEMTFVWNVLGKTGPRIFKAVVDPDNTVMEFNESNNTAIANMAILDLSLAIGTDKDNFKINQNVEIISVIRNLSSEKSFGSLTLITTAKDPLGNEVYTNTAVVTDIQPLSTKTVTVAWDTTGLNADGTYAISQLLLANSQVLAQSTKTVTLRKISDFTIRTDSDHKSVRQGEKTAYMINLEPLHGWSSGIVLNTEGLPAGTSVSFDSDNLVPPGQVLFEVITTDATPAGKYILHLVAVGMDEGEAVTHSLPLTLDIAGFGLEPVPSSITVKQLETGVLDINLHALNGYEGEVALNFEGLPPGIRTLSESSKVSVPGKVMLILQTSKFVKPGIYKLTITGNDKLTKHSLDLMITIADNPEISSGIIATLGPGPKNPASVSLIGKELKSILEFTAFNSKYGANVVSADIDGDGYDEIITAPGPAPKAKARIRVYRRDGSFKFEQTIFDAKYGLTVAAGDFDGDWKDELVVGMGPGSKNSPRIAILSFDGSRLIDTGIDFNAVNMLESEDDGAHSYGVNVAAGDVDGDKIPELVASPGFGHGSPVKVKVFKIDTSSGMGLWKVSKVYSEFDTATEQEMEPHREKNKERAEHGVNIAAGDVDGDNIAEIIVGAGPDRENSTLVKIFKGNGTFTGTSFIAYPDTGERQKHEKSYSEGDNENDDAKKRYRYGVYVSAVDLDGDGVDEIITGLGPGPRNPPWVKVFKADGTEVESFLSYQENTKYGVKVFTGKVGD